MGVLSALLVTALSGQALARLDAPNAKRHLTPRAELIQWQPCAGVSDSRYKCGKFEVPIDRRNAAGNKMTLPVARIEATQSPKKGTLFYNPGGPGTSGVHAIMGKAGYFDGYTGGWYDVVSWDPRGSGETTPRLTCFDSEEAYEAFSNSAKMLTFETETTGDFDNEEILDRWYNQTAHWDKILGVVQICHQKHGDYLKYIGTADTVHDMVAMADYLDGPGKPIYYHGNAYGSILGMYFVNMYPDRVGRVILDGVVNPVTWSERPSYYAPGESLIDSDEALLGFGTACDMAGPGSCAIMEDDWDKDDVVDFVDDFFTKAFLLHEKGIHSPYLPSILRFLVYNWLYYPRKWAEFATHLNNMDDEMEAMLGGGPVSYKALQAAVEAFLAHQPPTPQQVQDVGGSFANVLIRCSDAADGIFTTDDVMDEVVRITEEVTPRFGLNPRVWTDFHCHKLPVRAAERYQGPWNKKLAHPILIIGNEADPLTPFDSAKFVADMLGDSAILVERDDYGHGDALSSKCTSAIIHDYLSTGKLPSTDQQCSIDEQIFPPSSGSTSGVSVAAVKSSMLDTKKSLGTKGDQQSSSKPKGNNTVLIAVLASLGGLILLGGAVFGFLWWRAKKGGSGTYAKVGTAGKVEVVSGADFDIDEVAGDREKEIPRTPYRDPFSDHDHIRTESSSLLSGRK